MTHDRRHVQYHNDDHVHQDGTYEYHGDYGIPTNIANVDLRVVAKSWDLGDGNTNTVFAGDSIEFNVQ